MRTPALVFLFMLFAGAGWAQDCSISIRGTILDNDTDGALPFSTVYLHNKLTGTTSDINGEFLIEELCPGEYHIEFSHIGCTPEKIFIDLKRDTTLTIFLNHHPELLDEVVVHGDVTQNSTQVSASISRDEIAKESNKGIAQLLESLTGVSTLKNGSGISKPVIHGLYGNRISILNNGIAQSGQQWGNDHAPEIDPFVADHISVIKGASALMYGGNTLGGVVLIEPGEIGSDPHLHGDVNYIFQTNGRGHTVNTRLEKSGTVSWRLSGTQKYIGDRHTPTYFLTNTGSRESNIALQLNHEGEWDKQFYYSLFSTELGVLRGSHIGNLTNLEEALQREVPLFTEDAFKYTLSPPRQEVQHHLVKLKLEKRISEEKSIMIQYGGQINDRKEFDVRRGGRSNIPALSLQQFSNFLEGRYQSTMNEYWFLKTGVQFNYVDNDNDPGTGISPLIPWYTSLKSSAYAVTQREKNRLFFEGGLRYDLIRLDVSAVTQTIPAEIVEIGHNFQNFTLSSGLRFEGESTRISLNTGLLNRSPEVNELYSFGLHQGVSGIEEGNADLNPELSNKTILSIDWNKNDKLFIQALGYYQIVRDYIYLQPQNQFRLTIRGAFPVFIYEQTNAEIFGTDLQVTLEPSHSMKVIGKYSMVRGNDLTNNIAIINIPPANASLDFRFAFQDRERLHHSYLSFGGGYTANQGRLTIDQDFLLPPDDYFLVNASMGTTLKLSNGELAFSLRAENILNQSYRDYLNRLRYFADEMGRNISIGVNYSFSGK